MISKFLNFINQPFPDKDDLWSTIKSAFIGGVVVFLILFLLQPFGLNQTGSKILYYCTVYGVISIVVAILFDLITVFVLGLRRDTPDWKLWKWMVSIFIMVLLIAAANFAFSAYTFSDSMDITHFGYALYVTAVVSIFPIAIFGTLRTIKNLKENQKIAADISPTKEPSFPSTVHLPVHNSTSTFEIDTDQILYAEAMQNYVSITYSKNGEIKKELVRNTLTAIEEALSNSNIKKSHRSYLVNRDKIVNIKGNAQGLQLRLDRLPETHIPVSRKYIPEFKI